MPATLDSTTQFVDTERRHTSGAYVKRDIALVRGEGARVWDADGREYIDCTSGHGVANLGHAHPGVAAALAAQARTLGTCPEAFYNDRRAEALERLVRVLPPELDRVFFCNSGAEAVEGALKFARAATGRAGFVAAVRGFHGRTFGALSATWKAEYRQPFVPLVPDVSHVRFDDVDAADAAIDDRTAAVIVEIVQGEGGVRPGSAEYFRALRQMCAQRGALLIVDEVQTGFGRTGRWFAIEHVGVTPDIVCLGKAIAGGMPMGAIAIGPRVGPVAPGSHGSTFGGNPLACAAAVAALDAYESDGLIERSARLGEHLRRRLDELHSGAVRDVRSLGLMAGIELRTRVAPILRALERRGVLALAAGPSVLRLLPPLVISRQQIDTALDAVADALAASVQERRTAI